MCQGFLHLNEAVTVVKLLAKDRVFFRVGGWVGGGIGRVGAGNLQCSKHVLHAFHELAATLLTPLCKKLLHASNKLAATLDAIVIYCVPCKHIVLASSGLAALS